MTDLTTLVPIDSADYTSPLPRLSDMTRRVLHVALPRPEIIQRMAMEMVLRQHDPHGVLDEYNVSEMDFAVISRLPLYTAAHRQARDAIKGDPNYRTRALARAALEDSIPTLVDMTTSRLADNKDKLNAIKTLQGLASAGDATAAAAARKGNTGVQISINFGQSVGKQLEQVIRVESDE